MGLNAWHRTLTLTLLLPAWQGVLACAPQDPNAESTPSTAPQFIQEAPDAAASETLVVVEHESGPGPSQPIRVVDRKNPEMPLLKRRALLVGAETLRALVIVAQLF